MALVLGRVAAGPRGAALEALGPSEEHLPCQILRRDDAAAADDSDGGGGGGGGDTLQRGEHVWLFPRHICPTVNMYNEAVLVDGLGGCETVPVDARGH
eukprot:SAG22_NODE_4138_length_1370_cov_1.428796_2_plen_98_part_00